MMTLKAARVNKELTQKKAADLIGVNVSTLSKWEKGKSYPTNKRIPKILEVYGVSYDEIIFLPANYALNVKINNETKSA
jgi:putative transcriptional regulator